MSYLVAAYFAARNKEDMIEGFFCWTICNFSNWEKIPINPLQTIFFLHSLVLIIYRRVDFFETTHPKIIVSPLLNILFLVKNKRCYEM